MELLLNLAWLLLAFPAFLLWRDRGISTLARRFTSVQCMLALGCMLVVLFPVISATDDLRAMRAELEESPISKHNCCQRTAGKVSASKGQSQPALAATSLSIVCSHVSPYSMPPVSIRRAATPANNPSGRAPPTSLMA